MPRSKPVVPLKPRVAKLLESFSVEPGDGSAFRKLEGILSELEDWGRLAGVYECRLSVLEAGDPERPQMLLALGKLLEERLGDFRGARGRYQEAAQEARLEPEPLACMRRLHTRMGDFAGALQVAEVEIKIERPPEERALLLAEVGSLWRSVGESGEARRSLEQALQLDPRCGAALENFADLEEDAGRPDAALALLERRADRLDGSERAAVLDRMASLVIEENPERGVSLLREAVRLDPSRVGALDRLLPLEEERANWSGVDEVCLALWKLREGNAQRAGLALRAAEIQLESAGRTDAAIRWADRALEVAPNDPALHALRARMFRKAGRPADRIDALERLFELEGPRADLVFELASLHEQNGSPRGSIRWLRHHLETQPDDPRALAALDRCLAAVEEHAERVDVLERRVTLGSSAGERARLLAQTGRLCEELDDAPRAERAYRRAVAENPDAPDVVEGLERVLRSQSKGAELALLFEELAVGPAPAGVRAEWWRRLGEVRLDLLEDPPGAADAYRRALDLQPGARAAIEGLRQVARVSGDPALRLEAAERELTRAIEGPGLGRALREGVAAALEAGASERAYDLARRWVEAEPIADALEALATCAHGSQDTDGERTALRRLEPLVVDDPTRRVSCLLRLAEIEFECPDPEAARRAASCLEAALELAPGPEIRGRLREVYERAGLWSELAGVLREGLADTAPESAAAARLELGRVLERAGDREAAAGVLREGWALAPETAGLGDALESTLADLGRHEEVATLLEERLGREEDPERAQVLAVRAAELLLEELARPGEAAAILHDRVRPSRTGRAEELYLRALDASEDAEGLARWLEARAGSTDGPERVEILLRLAAVEKETGSIEEALVTLVRAECEASRDERAHVRRILRGTLEKQPPEAQLALLDRLLGEEIDSTARRELRLDRAALLSDRLARPGEACDELLRARREDPLPLDALRSLAELCGRLGREEERLPVLEEIGGSTDDAAERRRVVLERAALHASGPATVRDVGVAEALLRELGAQQPDDPEVFRRLSSLLEETAQHGALAELLQQRLTTRNLDTGECRDLTLRLAELEPARRAAKRLYDLRSRLGPDVELDHALADALRTSGRSDTEARLAKESALHAPAGGSERDAWLNRWIDATERSGVSPEALLEQIDTVLAGSPDEPVLLRERLRLVRGTGSATSVVEALERCLACPGALDDAGRRHALHELAILVESAPDRIEGVLSRLAAEIEADPGLAPRLARLATLLPDSARQIDILLPLITHPPEGFVPLPAHRRAVALALFDNGRIEEAEPLLREASKLAPRDVEILRAAEEVAQRKGNTQERLRWLEARFASEPPSERAEIARRGLELAQAEGDDEGALGWLRRWEAVEPLPVAWTEPWLELERAFGTPASELSALRTVCARTPDDAARVDLLSRLARRLEEIGERELARAAWREAVDSTSHPDAALLESWERLLHEPARDAERGDVLERLAQHPDVPVEQQRLYAATRAEILARDPEHEDEAVAALRRLVFDPDVPTAQRVTWGRSLLGLCRETGRDPEWCSIAEELIPHLPREEATSLERTLARRLAETLGARRRAIGCWRRLLDREPSDAEALRSLAGLLHAPGSETERAEALERLAACGVDDSASLLLEAARIRWKTLGDAGAAFEDLKGVIQSCPELPGAHELRLEVAARLNRPQEASESLTALLENADEERTPAGWLRFATLLSGSAELREEACRAAERGLDDASPGSETRRRLREVLEKVGDWDRVTELLREESAAVAPADRTPLVRRLARIEWRERRDAERAAEAFESLREQGSLTAQECALYSEVLESMDRWTDLLDLRAETLRLMGTSVPPGAWVELALSYLDRSEDAERAAAACDTALEIDASSIEALRLRADLDARLDDRAAEAARRETLANEILDPIESAAELARAAALRRDPLDQPEQASRLFRSALEREPGCLAALLGAGELAFERGRMDEAEPWLESAYRLLPGTDLAGRCAEIASLAARAAADLGLDEKALAHLEVALGESCEDPATVDLGATVALRLSAWQKARELLERRLSLPGLDDSGRADRLVRLARARESLDDRGAAADALEEAVRLRPSDEALRARLVDLLDELDEHRRLIEQLDGWAQSTGSDDAVALATRAARLELQHGDRARARERLDEIVLRYPGCADAWEEMAALQLDDGAPEEALARLTEGLEHVSDPSACAPLLGLKARALDALGQTAEAADAALAAVEANPKDAFAASYLAANVGRTGDWRRAAWALEHALDVARFPAPVQAEIWDAVGRVHAGPLQDLERAERAYRRALERNPDLDRAREALADVTSFDPAGHAESVALHLALLEKFPARGASWKALCRIAEHWKREEAIAACSWVLASLSRGESGPARAPALLAGLFPAPEVEVAAGLVRALEEAGHPMPQRPEDEASIPQPLTDAIEELAGALWRVPDEELGAVLENAVRLQDSADRRLRRRVREALRQSPPEAICALDPETCRSEILSTAVGRVAGRRGLEPRETFEALLGAWPATRELDLEVSGNIAEASQLCRPARTLLLRVAEGVKTRLGLG